MGVRERKQLLDKIEAADQKDLDEAAKAAELSGAEKLSLTHWRENSHAIETLERGTDVEGLYFAAKNPTMAKVFNKLDVAPTNDSGKIRARYDEMTEKTDKMEEHFTDYDFETALKKIRGHLG